MHRWSPADGLSIFLEPSGYAGPPDPALREPGANGLHLEPAGTVLVADSGNRAVVRLDPATKRRTTLAAAFDGKRFNSPNDVVRRSDGAIFFTDPPYGLTGTADSPARELDVSGVYRLDADGRVHLLDDRLAFPNGIALSPDERTLYVGNSDPSTRVIAYDLDDAGGARAPGLRRCLRPRRRRRAWPARRHAVAADGTLFATGPGGVIVFRPDGTRWQDRTGGPIANCALTPDGRCSNSPRAACSRGGTALTAVQRHTAPPARARRPVPVCARAVPAQRAALNPTGCARARGCRR